LFEALSSDTPIGDQDRVPILAGTGPGLTPQEPIALVIGEASDANNSIKDGTYLIRNPDDGCVWYPVYDPMQNVYVAAATINDVRGNRAYQVSLSS
jgi:hypothetical protein